MLAARRSPVVLALLAAIAAACVIDFDVYEPLTTSSGGAATGGGGQAGTGGNPTTSSMGGTGAGGETGGGGGAGGAPPCGTFGVLVDDFADGVVGDKYWTTEGAGATLTETAGERVVTLPDLTASWSGSTSKRAYDLRDSRAFIEITAMADPTTDAEAFFTINYGGGNYLSISQRLGQLRASRSLDDQWMQVASIDWAPDEQRWWQIREEAGTLYWEYSADGVDYLPLAVMGIDLLFPVDIVTLEFGAATSGTEVDPGEVHFDNLDGGGPTGVGWCPIADLTDDFEDPERSRIWGASYESASCTLNETGGLLSIAFDSDITTDCGYLTSKAFDLTDGALSIDARSFSGALPSEYAFFRAEIDELNGVAIVYAGDELHFQTEIAGTTNTHASFAYSETDDRWWRIRESGGSIFYDTSADGAVWDPRYDLPAPIDMTGLVVVIGAGVGALEATGGVVEFDDLNLLP